MNSNTSNNNLRSLTTTAPGVLGETFNLTAPGSITAEDYLRSIGL